MPYIPPHELSTGNEQSTSIVCDFKTLRDKRASIAGTSVRNRFPPKSGMPAIWPAAPGDGCILSVSASRRELRGFVRSSKERRSQNEQPHFPEIGRAHV